MSHRFLTVAALITVLSSFPVAASQPAGPAGKMLSNPLVAVSLAGESGGLPPVVCGGFLWSEELAVPPGPADSFTLDLAIVPFRAGPTSIRLEDPSDGRLLLRLRFQDGIVDGVPYDRSGWNDVQVELRTATQDYMLTVNGVSAGPFPFFDARCAAATPCTVASAFALTGDFLAEDTGWVDSVHLVRHAGGSADTLLTNDFGGCGRFPVGPGGMLVAERKGRLR